MTYKGITDTRMTFPIIGKLHKGTKKQSKNGKEYPGKNTDHFRFASDFSPGIEAAFTEALGPEPSSIPVYLPYQDVADNFDVWGYVYASSRLMHKCDGEFIVYYYDKKREVGIRPDYGAMPCKNPDCKPYGSLTVVIPALLQAGYVGTVLLTTTSERDMRNITGTLKYYHSLGGDLRGIQFNLFRYQFNAPTKGGPRRKQWFVGIMAQPSYVVNQLTAGEVTEVASVKELPAPSGIDPSLVDEETGEIAEPEVLEDELEEVTADEIIEPDGDTRNEQSPAAQAERTGEGGPFGDEPRNNPKAQKAEADDDTLAAMQRTRSLTGLSKTAAERYGVKQAEIVPILVETFGGSQFWPYSVDHSETYIKALEETFKVKA